MVILFVNFNSGDRIYGLPLLEGKYKDFEPEWFKNVGAPLCFTLFLNSFSLHFGNIGKVIFKLLKRFWDRGFSCKLRKDEDNDDVNTK
jgi:hypothetical protein